MPTNVTTDKGLSAFSLGSPSFRDLLQVGSQIQFIVEIRNTVTQTSECALIQEKKNLVSNSV